LEKIPKTIESNRQPNTAKSPTSPRVLNTSRDGDCTTALGSLGQGLMTLLMKKFFLISNLNLT